MNVVKSVILNVLLANRDQVNRDQVTCSMSGRGTAQAGNQLIVNRGGRRVKPTHPAKSSRPRPSRTEGAQKSMNDQGKEPRLAWNLR
jgi:hypothetical protein